MAVLWTLFVCCLAFISTAAMAASEREADRVWNLPEQPAVEFRHYAGYVQLRPPQAHKALFYWFFEAQEDASHKPLVLWLNGGPGCSSIAYGAALELGPFLVRDNGTKLTLNKSSWNKAANMLFLEAPVGVGFSYTNKSKDIEKLGDRITAEDSHAFLIEWFKRFPTFKSHDFYLAGESYAGHYVPQLAELIYERNEGASKDSYINFKGFMIGNAAIDDESDFIGLVEYAWSHAIISDQIYNAILKECDFRQLNLTLNCVSHFQDFQEAYADIDIYSIYTPLCLTSLKKAYSRHLLFPHELWDRLPSGYDPCTEDYVVKYFNREDVQKALHANLTKLPYSYTPCSDIIKKWNDAPSSILPIIGKLLKAGLRIWIYSGDTDGRVPVTGTKYAIKKMGLKVKEEWRAWFEKGQVGGWVETYEGGLTFATVRGAGHQVPVFAPHQSLSLFSHFLSAKILPSSRF